MLLNTFMRLMNHLEEFLGKFVVYLDDILIIILV